MIMVNVIFLHQMAFNLLVIGWNKYMDGNYQMLCLISVNVFVNLIYVKVNYHLFYHYIYVIMVIYIYTDRIIYLIEIFIFVDSTMEDADIIRMLRSSYLYALYVELCYNRGENEGKIMCSKILEVSF